VPCDPQAADAALIEGRLPDGELLGGERVRLARLLATDETGARGDDDGGLATRYPSFRIRRRQIEDEVAMSLSTTMGSFDDIQRCPSGDRLDTGPASWRPSRPDR
jgi:hypothetical protein